MDVVLRPATPADAEPCGRICYEAFRTIAERHGFPPDFPRPEMALAVMHRLLAHPGIHGVVAELGGRVVGSNFVDERTSIAGIGPITVDPAVQDRGIGRRLMEYVIARGDAERRPGIRLVQSGYHMRSLSLYTKLGFDPREPLLTMQGTPPGTRIPGRDVRPARGGDLAACNALATRVHGHDRGGELADAIREGIAAVVEHDGRISGYATAVAFFGHAVGETFEDVQALIAAAPGYAGPGFLVPTRAVALVRWCLVAGLRAVQPMTLMSRGLYNEPAGAWLPSIAY